MNLVKIIIKCVSLILISIKFVTSTTCPIFSEIDPIAPKQLFYAKAVYNRFIKIQTPCFIEIDSFGEVRVLAKLNTTYSVNSNKDVSLLLYQNDDWLLYYMCITLIEKNYNPIVIIVGTKEENVKQEKVLDKIAFFKGFLEENNVTYHGEFYIIDGDYDTQKEIPKLENIVVPINPIIWFYLAFGLFVVAFFGVKVYVVFYKKL